MSFKWWYAKEVTNYEKLLKEKTAILTAATDNNIIVQRVVSLYRENDLVVADCGPEGKYYLTPNQMVSQEDSLQNFWLVDIKSQWNTSSVLNVYATLEDNKPVVLPKKLRLYGKPQSRLVTFASRPVDTIVPIGEGNYIAWDRARNTCILIGDRETNETEIKILMEKTG